MYSLMYLKLKYIHTEGRKGERCIYKEMKKQILKTSHEIPFLRTI